MIKKPHHRALLVSIALAALLASPIVALSATPDADKNGTVDFSDFLAFVDAFGSNRTEFDFDDDGEVGFSDFILLVGVFGHSVPLSIETDHLADGILNEDYSGQLEASGGLWEYDWKIAQGALPEGLALSSAGVILTCPHLCIHIQS